jgi:hypothetical protein
MQSLVVCILFQALRQRVACCHCFFFPTALFSGYFLCVGGINKGNQVQGTLRCLARDYKILINNYLS